MVSGPNHNGKARGNLPPLSLYVPEPRFRPGDPVDFAHFDVPPAGAQPAPASRTTAS